MRGKNIMEDVTIYDILKNAPQGLKLYSPLFGDVEFHEVDNESESITVCANGSFQSFNKNGKYYTSYEGAECLLFPNKKCRTWDNWQFELFKPGDIVCNEDDDFYLCSESWKTFITVTGEKIENTGFLGALEYAAKEEREKFIDELAKNGFSWTELGLNTVNKCGF